jgi:hypothetical protein
MDAELRRLVRERAGSRCEYCGMRQEFDELPFQIEHVIPRKHHGSDEEDNLALACFACNNPLPIALPVASLPLGVFVLTAVSNHSVSNPAGKCDAVIRWLQGSR